ncbi:conserved hypothetical protein [Acinetobacter proteolyticus]|uniref:Prepilin-type N-terminal cleavage/methylation domain-containing protein n=1 Tax=Acinetobacter proteolyticus TaxID=1776741 RepID=A0A653K7B5_9GAMM|nr:prepilin-type N-terminal cleavage/methylation domain-containing protein [Acinetobacter proteolyticus]VXA56636.1 conserved hypothetical protein [Acinetobacter proteolyticus]
MGKTRGFTLIELMVAITVMAVIAMMAIPSFGNLVAKKQLDTTTKELALVFGEARGQAISLGKNITIKFECPPSPASCLNTSETLFWISPHDDIEMTSDAIDVTFTGLGIAKQRTKMVLNENFDENQPDSLELDPPTNANPSKVEAIVPLVFTLCNADIEESRTITVSKFGTVDGITSGTCS